MKVIDVAEMPDRTVRLMRGDDNRLVIVEHRDDDALRRRSYDDDAAAREAFEMVTGRPANGATVTLRITADEAEAHSVNLEELLGAIKRQELDEDVPIDDWRQIANTLRPLVAKLYQASQEET